MSRIQPLSDANATGEAALAYDEARSQFGGVINLFRVIGPAPNVLRGVLALHRHLGQDPALTPRQTELVAMHVSALNACDYCVNVHMQVGSGMGLSRDELLGAMAGDAVDEVDQALLRFAGAVVRGRGRVDAQIMDRVRTAGFSDEALLETIGVIGLYTTLQYIRHVADPAHDFPTVDEFDASVHAA